MSQAVITASLTVLTGTLVFVLGQLIAQFVIEPAHELAKLRGEIADSLVFYANVYTNPGVLRQERMDEASSVFRQQASQLRARACAVRWYRMWQLLKIVPKRSDIKAASQNLIGLSNSIHQGDPRTNSERRDEIVIQLKIDILVD